MYMYIYIYTYIERERDRHLTIVSRCGFHKSTSNYRWGLKLGLTGGMINSFRALAEVGGFRVFAMCGHV